MGDPVELGSNTGIIATISGGVTLAIGWGISLALKRMGITATSAAEANNAAQKDMLDWQREQLKDEVARREKAEAMVQALLEKQNELTLQLDRVEDQNKKLSEQVQQLTSQFEQLKASMAGTT